MSDPKLLQPPKVSSSGASGTEDEGEDTNLLQVDPFTHKLNLSRWEWIKVYFFTVTLLPLRVLALFVIVIGAWFFAFISLLGLSDEEQRSKPIKGWRKFFQAGACLGGRMAIRAVGFHSVVVKGRRVSAQEAPILVAAPHSSYFDGLVSFWSDLPYVVSREENRKIPFIGKCIDCSQAIYVSREDPQSRQKTVQEIIRRSTTNDSEGNHIWPQLLIFPEGSTANRTALMSFKPGAFYPGKPVQPVLIRFPDMPNVVTWTWNQDYGARTVLWLTMARLFQRAEIEYLPVYYPSEEEKLDPKLFARNVRKTMADALGVPTCDMTFEEVKANYGHLYKRKKSKPKKA